MATEQKVARAADSGAADSAERAIGGAASTISATGPESWSDPVTGSTAASADRVTRGVVSAAGAVQSDAWSEPVSAARPYRRDFGGPPAAPRLVLVHGLGGSHANWHTFGPLLADRTRPVAVDLAGFGLTPGGRLEAAVPANVRLLIRFLQEHAPEGAILLGNSMGGMIALLAAAAAPDLVRGAVLVDPALPRVPGAPVDPKVGFQYTAYSLPGVAEAALRRRMARVPAERRLADTLELCCVDPGRVGAEHIAAETAMYRHRETAPEHVAAYLSAARSLVLVLARRTVLWEQAAAVACPVLLVHGAGDRLVPVVCAQAAARRFPHWTYRELPGVGHTPQIEVPGELAAVVGEWLAAQGLG